jgi:hypothetical protein
VNAPGGNAMSWHSWGLAKRTHRVRPSEKTTPRATSGPSLARPSYLGWPTWRRGGLRTPAREASAWPRHVPGRPQASGLIIGCKWNAPACVRPVFADAQSASLRENHLSRHLQVCARKAISPWTVHPWRGGLRTPAGKVLAPPGHVPVGDPAPPGRTVKTEFLGTRLAIPCGRTECVPPRKPPLTPSPGLALGGHLSSDGRLRGGAGSARPDRKTPA